MLLELRQIRKNYGPVQVIRGIDLSIGTGEFVGMIGPNGSGKTTLFGTISGSLRCDSGAVMLDGRDMTSLGADQRCRAGIGRTFQIPQPFQGMTVYENALVASTFGARLKGRAASMAAREALDLCGLAPIADRVAGSLTLLQRKRLELARAIGARPRLLLLDEVGGGLTDGEMAELLALVVHLHAQGVTVLWIEHLVHALISVAQRLVVLTEGQVLADGLPTDVLGDAMVRRSYLGEEPDTLSQESCLSAGLA